MQKNVYSPNNSVCVHAENNVHANFCPIVCVYIRKCAANIVEKYERRLVVG